MGLRAPEVAAFVTIALTCLFCTAEASRAGDFLFSAPWRSASGRGLENRKLQQAEPALDVLTPQCFWAGADCRADVDALFPDFSLYYDVVSHRANASVCLSWSAEIVGNCRNAAPTWCKTTQIDDDLQICLPAAANTTILQQAWGQGIAGFRDASDFIERNCDTPSSWVSDIFMVCIDAWIEFLAYIGHESDGIQQLRTAHSVCGRRTSKDVCLVDVLTSSQPPSPLQPPSVSPPPPASPVSPGSPPLPSQPSPSTPNVVPAPPSPPAVAAPESDIPRPAPVPVEQWEDLLVQDMGACDEDSAGETTCAPNFAKCTGTGFQTAMRCCNPEHVCIRKNLFYGQCRDARLAAQRLVGWSGEFVHCSNTDDEDTATWFTVNNVPVGESV